MRTVRSDTRDRCLCRRRLAERNVVPVSDLDTRTTSGASAVADIDPLQAARRSGVDIRELEPEKPKKPQRSIFAKISTAHFLMAVFGLLGFGLTLSLLQQSEATTTIVVATEDLNTGARLAEDAIGVREVPLDGPLAGVALTPDDVTSDMALVAPVVAGAPILASVIVEESPLDALNSFSVPIEDERALGGEFQSGDRVHLISVVEFGNGLEKTAVSTYVAVDVPVLGDRELQSSAFGATLSDYYVAVGLNPDQSLEASSAMMRGRLEVVRAGDEAVDTGTAAISTTGGMTIVRREEVAPLLAGLDPATPQEVATEETESDGSDEEGDR